ncbi:hypothetical protein J1N35_013410 [Gossypium stocksii]|uniref:RNase H type-1 domain-containing protein n=1 Tax=Gossypium stocksii TaxID=47602 RepID=A0A9D3VU17_9ROSI|nr:hypothetical protein J1N35_013410 [Gossypium stocksii]
MLFFSRVHLSPGWMKFNMVGVVIEDKAGCGGVFTDGKGMARSLFSRLVKAMGSEIAEVMAIKTALGMYIDIGWHVKLPLIIKSSSCDALEQLMERNHRLRTLRSLFIIVLISWFKFTSHLFTSMLMVWLMFWQNQV